MKEYTTNCPCCNNQIKIIIKDDGTSAIVFFNDKKLELNENEIFEKHGICLGMKGGETVE